MCLSNKMLPIPFDMESCCSALLHELNYFSCLYSGAAPGNMTLITWVVHMGGLGLHVSLISPHFVSLSATLLMWTEVWRLYKVHI